MRITINLATRPFADIGPMIKRLRIGMGALAVVSIGLGVGLHLLHHKAEAVRAHEHSLDGDICPDHDGTAGVRGDDAPARQRRSVDRIGEPEQALRREGIFLDAGDGGPGNGPSRRSAGNDARTGARQAGHITLRLRIVGPRDKDLETVQNLEHSRHFLLPRIVGESAENNGGPGERLEPVSASNRVTFELLADYNRAALAEAPAVKKPAEDAGKKEKAEHAAVVEATRAPARPGSSGPGLRRVPMTGVARPQPVTPPSTPQTRTPQAQRPSPPKPQAGEPK